MKLYTHSPSPNCIKVTALVHYLQLPVDLVELEPHSGACRTPEFLAKNPNGLLPTLEDDGYCLWESNAILVYLAQKASAHGLLPSSPKEHAEFWRWMCWGMCHWAPALKTLMFEHIVQPLIHHQPTDQAAVIRAEAAFQPLARLLDEHLVGKKYLLGDQLSLADFSLGAYLAYAELAKIPLASCPSIQAWYGRLEAMAAWQKALPVHEMHRT